MAFQFARKLSAPYPCDFSPSTYLRVGSISGAFIFLFFLLFQPFGLAALKDPTRLRLYAGYGIWVLLLIVLNNVLLPRLLPGWFREEQWNIGKHILYATWIILTIGLACFFFTRHVFLAKGIPLRSLHLTLVVGGALAIGAIPVTIMTLLDQVLLLRRSDRAAVEANRRIDSPHDQARPAAAAVREVTLVAENGKDTVRFAADSLLYIAADENYVTLHTKTGTLSGALLRSSLTRVEHQLWDFRPNYFRCHRAYIVNADKIRKVSGNAQGLKLSLEGGTESIPVARRYVEEFRRLVVPKL
jgi:hypothetical protein